MTHPLAAAEADEGDRRASEPLPRVSEMTIQPYGAGSGGYDALLACGGIAAKWDGTGLPATIKEDPAMQTNNIAVTQN